jgi:hypothetical protein
LLGAADSEAADALPAVTAVLGWHMYEHQFLNNICCVEVRFS